ncbi:hypothetical protein BRADI_1g47614v3 [Brachypodium distachyon]|uniref:Uncharacterized protein n=1 Tax=Brachypodium distachyon TaxID=15368 RepID=A0A2K2DQ29_BRADI|nr:hypothetical protein BRADI_1g47614v3 [Brachypodium distachyon]
MAKMGESRTGGRHSRFLVHKPSSLPPKVPSRYGNACWEYICPTFSAKQNVHDNVIHLKEELKVPFHLEIMVLCTWSIWKSRNDFIFNNIQPSFYRCRRLFKEELILSFIDLGERNMPTLSLDLKS